MKSASILTFAFGMAARLSLVSILLAGLALVAGARLPNGGVIAFMSTRDGNADIYAIDVSQHVLVNLTRTPERGEFDPAWSPDGEQLAFAVHEEVVGFDLHVMRMNGGDSRQLTDDGSVNILPAWSPDGQRIAFSSDRSGSPQLYLIHAECDPEGCGSQVEPLTQDTTNELFDRAAWSPDGRRIAYTAGIGGTSEIYVMDGSSIQALTQNATADAIPAWSPDGQRIAFVSTRDGNAEIYVMNADGSHVQRLTENISEDNSPAWSPDGRRIAFTSLRDGNAEIYVMSADGSHVQRLTQHDAEDSGPVWWPGGS